MAISAASIEWSRSTSTHTARRGPNIRLIRSPLGPRSQGEPSPRGDEVLEPPDTGRRPRTRGAPPPRGHTPPPPRHAAPPPKKPIHRLDEVVVAGGDRQAEVV